MCIVLRDTLLIEVFVQAITGLTKLFPSQVSAHFTQLLTVVWNLLTSSADRYVRTKVNSTDVLDDAIDSDGDNVI
jgi:hypothetical protein